MARAKRVKTRYQNVYYRDLPRGRVYDITYRWGNEKEWESGFPTEEAARERLAEQQWAARQGGTPPSKRTKLQPFVDESYEPRQQARVDQGLLRASTFKQYRRDLRLHILPRFANWRIDQIDLAAAQRFHDDLCRTQSNWSVRRIVNTLSGVLELARKQGRIRHNPVRDVEKIPAKSKRGPVILTLAQFWETVEAARAEMISAIVILAGIQGLRQSEIFGLRWPNIDLSEGQETMMVTEQHYRGETIDKTKTQAGMRLIPLAPQVAEELRAHYLWLKLDGRPNPLDLVFPNSRGSHMRASNFTSGPWKRIREAVGLADLDFQDLRDFYVSHIRGQNLSTAMTMQLTGHADERVHDSYTHPIPGTEDAIRAALAKAFAPPSGSTVVAPEPAEG